MEFSLWYDLLKMHKRILEKAMTGFGQKRIFIYSWTLFFLSLKVTCYCGLLISSRGLLKLCTPTYSNDIMKKFIAIMFSVALVGCATPVEKFSQTPSSEEPLPVEFILPGSAQTSITIYRDGRDCRGMRPLTRLAAGGREVIYLPKSKYITFAAYIKTPGIARFTLGGGTFSAPTVFEKLRVRISHDDNRMYVQVEGAKIDGEWAPVVGVIQREPKQPLISPSEAWCELRDELG